MRHYLCLHKAYGITFNPDWGTGMIIKSSDQVPSALVRIIDYEFQHKLKSTDDYSRPSFTCYDVRNQNCC